MEMQKCESSFCIGTNLYPASNTEQEDRCPICMSSLKEKEITMLEECNHISCSSCMKYWAELKNSCSCPLCRRESRDMICSKSIFKADEKTNLFSKHSNCYLNDPQFDPLKPFLEPIDNNDWCTFIKFMLTCKHQQTVSYDFNEFCDLNGVELTYFCTKFATFKCENFIRLIIYLQLPGIDIQLTLTDEDLKYSDTGDNLSDKFVNYLNQQWRRSWKSIPHVLNREMIVMTRKFKSNLNCLLKLEVIERNSVEYVESEVIMKEQMSQLPFTNIPVTCMIDLHHVCDKFFLFE